ncbi:MAG TPA: SUMF1/EgtB/PvdO family nonheme iron enzyme [Planctomycetota bacterium]
MPTKKLALIGGGALLLIVAAFVLWPRPAPPPPPKVVEAPKGPDPALLAKIAELKKQVEEYEGKGRFNEALVALKELAALEPAPGLAEIKTRLEGKRSRFEAWQGGVKKAEAERADAARRNTAAGWQKVVDLAAEAEKLAAGEEQTRVTRGIAASARQQLLWCQARDEEKAGKLDAAIDLAAQAVAAAPEPPAELTAYKTGLDRRKRKGEFDKAAYAARAEGVPTKAYELWQKARPLAEDPKDVAEADARLHALKPFVDPAERERRYEEALKAGDAALAAGEFDAAEKAFKEAQALKVTDAKPAQGLVKVTAARNAKGVETHLAAARDAEGKKEWADAIEAYDRALRIRPGDAASTARRKELEAAHRPPKIQLKLSESTGITMELVLVKRGKFTMGDPRGGSDEKPRDVEIAKDFWMQTTELTQAQWELVMNTRPWVAASVPLLPVEGVSWEDVQKYLEKLSPLIREQLKGRRLALPTEAEWEYACRAGTSTRWSFGDDESQFDLHGWNTVNATKAPQLVAKKRPNPWGLFDMHGNVAEWCADEAGKTADDAPALRWVRGGSWNDRALNCRSSKREKDVPSKSGAFLGFRVILRPP